MNERFTNSDKIEQLSVSSITEDERIHLLGALGLVDAAMFDYINPDEAPNYWKSAN